MTTEYGTHLIKPYEGAGDAFEGIWKRWHQWEWTPENTCRVDNLYFNMLHGIDWDEPCPAAPAAVELLRMFPALKTALATPNWDCGGTYEMMENPGYGCLDTEVTYSPPPDHEYEDAQELICEFEAKLLAWCKSIDGGK